MELVTEAALKIRRVINQILNTVNLILFAGMVLIGTYQIVVRYCFNRPSTVTEELLTYSFTWLSLLSATYIFGKRGHMRMGFLADRASKQVRIILEIISEILIFAFSAIVMVYGGVSITALAMSQKTASLGVSKGLIYVVIPLSGILIITYSILNLLEMRQDGE